MATSFSSEKSKLTTRNAWKITMHPKTSYKKFPSHRDTIWVASVSDSYTDIHGCVGTYIEHYTANERFIYASIPYDWYIKRMIWVSFIDDLFEIAVNIKETHIIYAVCIISQVTFLQYLCSNNIFCSHRFSPYQRIDHIENYTTINWTCSYPMNVHMIRNCLDLRHICNKKVPMTEIRMHFQSNKQLKYIRG